MSVGPGPLSDLERRVAQALAVLPLDTVAARLADGVARYIDELRRWNRVMSLSAQNEIKPLIAHVIDALSVYPLVDALMRGGRRRIADIGSGNGLAAIPLALYASEYSFSLVESRQKRCAFLHSVIAILRLTHCAVVNARLEELSSQSDEPPQPSASSISDGSPKPSAPHRYDLLLIRALPNWSRQTAACLAELITDGGSVVVYANAHSPKSDRISALLQHSFAAVRTAPNALLSDTPRTFIIASQTDSA